MNGIRFDREAENWNEAIPVGNGFLGAMVFGRTNTERIQVNEDSVWSGGPMDRNNPDGPRYLGDIRNLLLEGHVNKAEELAERGLFPGYIHMRHYQTMGDIWIDFFSQRCGTEIRPAQGRLLNLERSGKPAERYERSLNLETAVGNVSYIQDQTEYMREFFASAPDHVLVYRMKAEHGVLDFAVNATRKENISGVGSSYCDGSEVLGTDTIRLHGWQGGPDGIGFELMVRVVSRGGRQHSAGSRIIVEQANEAVLYITARTTYRSKDPSAWCLDVLNEAEKKGYRQILDNHVQDYQAIFSRSRLSLNGDAALASLSTPQRLERVRQGETDLGLLETYYDFARYLLISSSRPGSLPANLQGIWNQDFAPAWGSKYTINVNIQMNYWIAEKTGLGDLHMALLNHLKVMHPRGCQTARIMYGCRGFVCHHNTDIWGDCAPQDNHVSSTLWPMGGAWLCLHLIEHYRYSKDRVFMEEFYPILKDSVLFFLDFMTKDRDGYWVSGPGSSPENIYRTETGECGCLCMGATMDNEILRELFTGFLEVSEDLEKTDLVEETKEKLAGLYPVTIGQYGQIQEWNQDYEEVEPGHRHISQLFGLYPGASIRKDETPELAAAAEKTIERRLASGGGHTGWSKAWITLFYARLKDAEKAWSSLQDLLGHLTLDNLFNNHPPFQIDGNFGGAAAILEMLVQDYGDKVILLPALPEQLSAGSLSGIRLKAGAVMDLKWENGQVTSVKIMPERDGIVQLMTDRPYTVELKAGEASEPALA